jgi:hypothetical protein
MPGFFILGLFFNISLQRLFYYGGKGDAAFLPLPSGLLPRNSDNKKYL